MSRQNRLGGAPRIHSELLKLGIDVSETVSVQYGRICPQTIGMIAFHTGSDRLRSQFQVSCPRHTQDDMPYERPFPVRQAPLIYSGDPMPVRGHSIERRLRSRPRSTLGEQVQWDSPEDRQVLQILPPRLISLTGLIGAAGRSGNAESWSGCPSLVPSYPATASCHWSDSGPTSAKLGYI